MLQLDCLRDGPVPGRTAPIPVDPLERARHLKSAAYFMDAAMVGICAIAASARLPSPLRHPGLAAAAPGPEPAASAALDDSLPGLNQAQLARTARRSDFPASTQHPWALVLLIDYPRDPRPNEPGGDWLVGMQEQRAAVRAGEVVIVLAQYIRSLGYGARAHTATTSNLDLDALIVDAGLGIDDDAGGPVSNPFLRTRFGVAAVSTDLTLEADRRLDASSAASARDFKWWIGAGGVRPGYQGETQGRRPYHLGRYRMDSVRRSDATTTFIDSGKVPRVPKRHDMFVRAVAGDLGDKARRELEAGRCVTKCPFANAIIPLMSALVPMQTGPTAPVRAPNLDDPLANSKRVKAALHYLGADIVGISEAPDFVWYSHQADGTPIVPYHRYAISVLIDQGYPTMEGSSGDDWINAAQNQRGYLRGNLVCSILAAHIRNLGYGARVHSNGSQDVLHVPLLLLGGLGELSRIGEVVLNPFLGPRFKSAIITTDLPLAVDRPIDFGMQDFCTKCTKCARECPCSAITFGPKIRFNGYQMWKPDVEKCARYRITNAAGAMCGRCLKTCPWNIEGVLSERPFRWAAINLPFTRRWLATLDDKMGNGRLNPLQKWWWDLDTQLDGRMIVPARTNARGLNFRPPMSRDQQKLAAFPLPLAPAAGATGAQVPDRKAGIEWYRQAEAEAAALTAAPPPQDGTA